MALEPNKFITYYVQADIFALMIKHYYKYLWSIGTIRYCLFAYRLSDILKNVSNVILFASF